MFSIASRTQPQIVTRDPVNPCLFNLRAESYPSHDRYNASLLRFNQELQEVARLWLNEAAPKSMQLLSRNTQNASVIFVGSDARIEKSIYSPLELVVLANCPSTARCLGSLLNSELKEYNLHKQGRFDPDVDIRCFTKSSVALSTLGANGNKDSFTNLYTEADDLTRFSYHTNDYNQASIISVNRMMDAQTLIGNGQLLIDARQALYQQLSDPKIMSQVVSSLKKRYKESLKICKTGFSKRRGQKSIHFNLVGEGEGSAYYDGINQFSFKLGPLRFIQFKLMHDLLKAVQMGKVDFEYIESCIISRTHSTTDRLKTIGFNDLYSFADQRNGKQEMGSLIDTYSFFLWLYHQSQEVFHTANPDGKSAPNHIMLSETIRSEALNRMHFLFSLVEKEVPQSRSDNSRDQRLFYPNKPQRQYNRTWK